ncbi:lantibiotic dehydratase [Bacillus paranthracis]|uniref:Lantibiotic dehydratase n=1 Tax=Bacillus paranthracis TaxID=2026186 RepID=A0AAJ1NMZ9_9BACI|nr:lantibiotic dehydratase [Bacillus paranthracis]MDG0949136.1 lantibiotic dehydratase [Bacillus paranthracis]MDG0954753.1 lantibiotic dehydratase [Bacillus paranthracis]
MKTYFSTIQKYMLRVPLQPNSLIEEYDDIENNIENIVGDKFLCEQLLVASENIYNTLVNKDFTTLSKKKQRNLITSLGNYINRAATRTTPFGLFSGVTILNLNERETLEKTIEMKYQKHSRIDVEWLFRLIKKIELEHFSILKFKMNTANYRRGDRLYLPYTLDGKSAEINVNYSKPLEIIKNLCKKKQISFNEIINALKEEYPQRNLEALAAYVKILIEKDFLISELRPPICNTDILTYTINEISKYSMLHEKYGEPLSQVKSLIVEFNNKPIGDGIDVYLTIQEKMKGILSYTNEKFLQVDTEIVTNNNYLCESDITNINECITLFMKFAPEINTSHNSNRIFEEYRLKFIEKFGDNVEVPAYEVVNEISGIGAPKTYSKPKNKFSQDLPINDNDNNSILKKYFMDKYLSAIENKQPIVIKDEEINRLKLKIEEGDLPNSLELNFIIRKNESGENRLFLGPNVGSPEAGKTFGRFSYMADSFTKVLEEIETKLDETKTDRVELSFIPTHIRSANVMRVNSPRKYNMSLFTNTDKSNDEITLSDVLVGYTNKYFYLKNKNNGRLLNISGSHMLNLSATSNVIRLLSDITLFQKLDWMTTPWEVFYKDFIHIPENRYKNITLSNEKWSLQNFRNQFEKAIKFEEFTTKFEGFRNVYSVPNRVYLQFADNRILLDLTKYSDLNLLYKNFFKYPAVILEKEEAGHPVINIGEDSFSAEVVVPFILKDKYRVTNTSDASYGNLYNEVQYAPFKEWLFLKLYGPEDRQNELIGYLHHFILNQLEPMDCEKFFYMRYNDPKPHIRLRFKSDNPNKLMSIYLKLNSYLLELQKMNIVSEVSINTYFPEVNRYGGPPLIRYAEDLFYRDSLVVMNLLEFMKNQDYSKEQMGVISLIHYLKAFGLTFESQLKFLELNLKNDDIYKKQFKAEKFDFINELDSYNDWDEFNKKGEAKQITKFLNARNESVSNYLDKITCSDNLTNDLGNIIGSVIHLHFNRLFKIDRDFEDKIYSYAYHTLYGQRILRKIEK